MKHCIFLAISFSIIAVDSFNLQSIFLSRYKLHLHFHIQLPSPIQRAVFTNSSRIQTFLWEFFREPSAFDAWKFMLYITVLTLAQLRLTYLKRNPAKSALGKYQIILISAAVGSTSCRRIMLAYASNQALWLKDLPVIQTTSLASFCSEMCPFIFNPSLSSCIFSVLWSMN